MSDEELIAITDRLLSLLDAFGLTPTIVSCWPESWEQGRKLIADGDTRLGYTMLLATILHTPGAPKRLIEALHCAVRGVEAPEPRRAA